MRIVRILNNNAAIIHENGYEKVVMGKGLSFGKRPGDEIDKAIVDKTFVLSDDENFRKIQQLFKKIPYEYALLAEKIISYAKEQLGKKLDEKIYIDLTDHIYGAVQRKQEGVDVKNVLLWDIRKFYPEEFAIGRYALDQIEASAGVRLEEDEAGFIGLHLVNAEMGQGNIEEIYQMTEIINDITSIVKYTFHIEYDESSVYYYRFMTHLRFFALRMVQKTPYDSHTDEDLYELIQRKYHNAYEGTLKITELMQKKYGYVIGNEEQMYLTIHINRLVYQK